ncbi:MAG TPA: glycosyltransferase family 4 protein [Falsiroseomonas sp.]|jgi:glycosyltransferase involved in cell wall biosynthesis|nr:glycosyltransferase family 4 protein [Falsiroseomonas sp.]
MSAGRPVLAAVLPFKEGFAPDSAGAIGLVVRDVARATAASWETIVIGRAAGGPTFPGCGFVTAPPRALARMLLGANLAYARAVRRAARAVAPKLVEVHNRPTLALSMTRLHLPVLLVLHNDPRGMRAASTPTARTRLLTRLAGVVCISDWVRQKLLEGVGDAALARKAHVIPNGLDLDAAPPPTAEREKLILFVGRITADKGFDSFVRACALALPALPGWRVEAIGGDRLRADGPASTAFIRSIRPEAEAAGIAMPGFLDNARTLAAMSHAAMLVMPSRWEEPFGRVAQEAHLAGAALIASRRGGLPEAAGEAALYVDPDRPEEIAAAIRRLAEDPALALRLREAGAAHVRQFGLERTGARWSALREMIAA